MDALTLLSGDAQTFRDKIWASRVHLHHTDPADLVGLLSLDDVDHLLTSTALRTPALRVVKDAQIQPATRFTRSATMAGAPLTGLVDAAKVLALFDEGATVVLQGLHRYWPPLTELIRSLELALGHPCQANAYLTPPGSQGFARHSDSHDVFVFQTHGHKRWEIVDGDQERDVVLEPGLSMYLPTGTPHSARSQDETSLHVTVGINQVTWRQLLGRLAEEALGDEEYDERLPAGYLDEPALLASALTERLTSYAARLGERDADEIAETTAHRFLQERTPALRGGLSDRVAMPNLDDDTVLTRRPTAACALREDDGKLLVLLGDRALRMPLRLRTVLEHIRDHDTLTVRDLSPWLDQDSRLVLARRLVREGLLRIAP